MTVFPGVIPGLPPSYYEQWPPQKIDMALPDNLLQPSSAHMDELRRHVAATTPPDYPPFTHPQAYPMTEKGRSIFADLLRSHDELKAVEAEIPFKDIEEIEIKQRVEECHDQTEKKLCESFQSGSNDAKLLEQKDRADREFSTYFLPDKSLPRYKVWRARQDFLNALGASFTYLQGQGMPAFWHARSDIVANAIRAKGAVPNVAESVRALIPLKRFEYLRKEADDYQNDFSQFFLMMLLRQVRNAQHSRLSGLKLSEIQFKALSCLKQLVHLRLELEKRPREFPTEIMAKFAHYFREVKRQEFELTLGALAEENPPEMRIAISIFKPSQALN